MVTNGLEGWGEMEKHNWAEKIERAKQARDIGKQVRIGKPPVFMPNSFGGMKAPIGTFAFGICY